MNESTNYTEYVVSQKAEGKWMLRRLLLIGLYVVFSIAWLIVVVGVLMIWPLGMFTPLLTWMLVFFTWRYVSVEHEYVMSSGVITFSDIYGRRTRRQKAEFRIKELTKIAPAAEYEAKDTEIVYDFRGSEKSPDSYFFTFRDENGKNGTVFFEATAKSLKIFRFYNPSATVMSDTLRY